MKSRDNNNHNYEKVANGVKNIEPYTSISKNELLDLLGQDDIQKKIISSLGNRKDADKIFVSAILTSWKFWGIILALIFAFSIGISYLFVRFPSETSHVVEKTVNSKIPDLLPNSR